MGLGGTDGWGLGLGGVKLSFSITLNGCWMNKWTEWHRGKFARICDTEGIDTYFCRIERIHSGDI
jgi:hypothetical protein